MTPEEREVVQEALEVLVECQPFKLTDEACTRHWNAKYGLIRLLAEQPHYSNTSNPVDFPKLGCVNHDCAECYEKSQAKHQEDLNKFAEDSVWDGEGP